MFLFSLSIHNDSFVVKTTGASVDIDWQIAMFVNLFCKKEYLILPKKEIFHIKVVFQNVKKT